MKPPSAYGTFLKAAYGSKPAGYYSAFLRIPVQPGASILDWGCGLGGMLNELSRVPQVRLHGLDMLPDCVEATREHVPTADVRLLPAPGHVAPWDDDAFDRIFLLDVIEHAFDPLALLSEIHRILKPDGIVTLCTPDRLAFYKKPGAGVFGNIRFNIARLRKKEWVDPTHRIEHTTGTLRSLLRQSPFGDSAFRPVFWHGIPWIRPPKRHFSFVVDLRK